MLLEASARAVFERFWIDNNCESRVPATAWPLPQKAAELPPRGRFFMNKVTFTSMGACFWKQAPGRF